MAAQNSPARPGFVSLIASGKRDAVPSGIRYGMLPLPSLDTAEVRDWVAAHRQYEIYLMAGADLQSEGVPALSVPVSAEDYESVAALMPR